MRSMVQMNNKVNPSSAEGQHIKAISDNILVEPEQEPGITREEEWDLCQEGLDSFGSDHLLFPREVENIQREEEQGQEEKDRNERRKKERKTILLCCIFPVTIILLILIFI